MAGALLLPRLVLAQETAPASAPAVHQHVDVSAPLLTSTRDSSGTAWLPDSTPMTGIHRAWRAWDLRLTGTVFAAALGEPGERHRTGGDATRQLTLPNWMMAGARRPLGGGRFGVRLMLSAEPLTVPGCGAISFLAIGEVCDGDTIHDRQQPHDLLMELAADYDRPLAGVWRWRVYAGLAGEPALGPPAYPHRSSAVLNPVAPLGHHWLDATHVTFGVVTGGVQSRRWALESSVFNGRAPDESRADVDLGRFDSVSARVSVLPSERLALQVSAGRVHEARTTFFSTPRLPAVRVTASAIYHRPVRSAGLWATTLALGTARLDEPVGGARFVATTAMALVESTLALDARHVIFARGELGRVPAHDLHAAEYGTAVFGVAKVQAGYARQRSAARGLVAGVGGSVALSLVPPALAPRYGGRVSPGVALFVTLRGAPHQM